MASSDGEGLGSTGSNARYDTVRGRHAKALSSAIVARKSAMLPRPSPMGSPARIRRSIVLSTEVGRVADKISVAEPPGQCLANPLIKDDQATFNFRIGSAVLVRPLDEVDQPVEREVVQVEVQRDHARPSWAVSEVNNKSQPWFRPSSTLAPRMARSKKLADFPGS